MIKDFDKNDNNLFYENFKRYIFNIESFLKNNNSKKYDKSKGLINFYETDLSRTTIKSYNFQIYENCFIIHKKIIDMIKDYFHINNILN